MDSSNDVLLPQSQVQGSSYIHTGSSKHTSDCLTLGSQASLRGRGPRDSTEIQQKVTLAEADATASEAISLGSKKQGNEAAAAVASQLPQASWAPQPLSPEPTHLDSSRWKPCGGCYIAERVSKRLSTSST